jgi:hypothetical protein
MENAESKETQREKIKKDVTGEKINAIKDSAISAENDSMNKRVI